MEKCLILLVLSLSSSELRCQVIVSHVKGSALITNLTSHLTNATSVVNLANSNEDDQPLIYEGNYILPNEAYDIKAAKNYYRKSTDSIDNVHKTTKEKKYYPTDEGEYTNVGPEGILIHRVQDEGYNDVARKYYPATRETIDIGRDGIFIQKVRHGVEGRSPMSNVNDKSGVNYYYPVKKETIKLDHDGISIWKFQSNGDPTTGVVHRFPSRMFITNLPN